MSNLGSKPSPDKISFAAECFERVGTNVEFVIVMSAPSYPKSFADESEAIAASRKYGRPYHRRESPKMRRVKWA